MRRVTGMTGIFVGAMVTGLGAGTAPAAAGQGPPPDAPGVKRVTDRARPDFGYAEWAGSDVSIVIVLSARCEDCAAAVPFYKELRSLIGPNTSARSLVFMARDGIWPAVEMIERHEDGFPAGRVVSYPLDDRFELGAMPAVLVIDGRWARKGKWEGRLDHARQREVVAQVKALIDAGDGSKKGGARE